MATKSVGKVWKLYVPIGGQYADLVALALDPPKARTCKVCGNKPWVDDDHVEVVWEPGADQIADFTNGVGCIIVKEEIADALLSRFKGFEKGRVVMAPDPKGKRPKRITKRTKLRVWLPYDGPPLVWLHIVHEAPLLPQSTVTVEEHCPTCGYTLYREFVGIEEKNSARHTRRQPGKGFFFSHQALAGRDFFCPKHTGFNLCTDRAKEFILSRGWNNIEFLEVGDILADN
jgi:hypothetical protein